MGPQGNRHCRDRDAGADGHTRGIWPGAAAARGAHLRLVAHDHPDRRADRDPRGAGRRRSLGLLQYLFDPGPRRSRGRRRRHAGIRRQGRDAEGVLGLSTPDLRVVGRRRAQHDPRRRRRRHAADSPRPACRAGRDLADQPSHQRGRGSPVRLHQGAARGRAGLVPQERRGDPRRHRGNHHRGPPALRDAEEGHAAVAGNQRQRQRDQVQVRQPLWLPRIAGRRHPARHRRDDGGKGRHGRGLRRRRQGFGRLAAAGGLPGHWSPRSIRSAHCRRRWKATRSPPWRMPRRAPTFS